MKKENSIFSKLGPGLLYAGAAIGVSHLVQSTRAGASFGIVMILVVILANFFKYPFFQYGPRYAAATGKSLLHGYKKLGSWAIWIFFLLTIGTMFIIQGAVTMVTAGLAIFITGSSWSIWLWMLLIMLLAVALLASGKIKVLDKFMKIVMVILAITTIAAAISSFFAQVPQTNASPPFSFANREHIFFLIAFIGWMPAPIDISVWYSVWSETKAKTLNEQPNLKSTLFDFSVGYWGTAFLALCFVALGAFMLHNTGIELSPKAVIFAGQIIEAYTQSLGSWATPIISIAAFTTMFSTTISVMDGITRVMVPTTQYLINTPIPKTYSNKSYVIWLLVLASGSMILVSSFTQNMKQMVDFATSISFLTAPILAYLNLKVMHSNDIPEAFRPSTFTRIISYIGLAILVVFSLVYLGYKL
jgi:Mn2+/Fe2+ NRAMP family transporter